MAAASTVKFDIGGTFVIVNGPESGSQPRLLPQTAQQRTPNHQLWIYRLTDVKKWIWSLTLRDLTREQKLALELFVAETAIWSTNAFTYTHTDGRQYANCRFTMTDLAFTRTGPTTYDLPIEFELGTQPDLPSV